MKYKGLCLALVLVSLLALMVMPHPAYAPPWAGSLIVSIYPNTGAENAALQAGTIDVIDHPLDKFWIDTWTGNPAIKMDSYASAEKKEFDINCQRWPTGITLPRILDPATGTYKHWQDYSDPWEVRAREFRRAVAYLSDKDGYIDRILNGYGYRIDTTVPAPFLAAYVNDDVSGVNYPYRFNPTQAKVVLDNAGFTEGTTPNPYYYYEPPKVVNPSQAYDGNEATYACVNYDRNLQFELAFPSFNSEVNSVDFVMRYGAEAASDGEYRILYQVGNSAAQVLQPWTNGFAANATRTWLNQPEPLNNVWESTDIGKIKLRVETRVNIPLDPKWFFLFEAWLVIHARGAWSPSSHNIDALKVANPSNAYDDNEVTYAWFNYNATGQFELAFPSFSLEVESVDFEIKYGAEKAADDLYRIIYYVSNTTHTKSQVLQPWTKSSAANATRIWLNPPEPLNGTWESTDIGNMKLKVETQLTDTPDQKKFFLFEARITVHCRQKWRPNSDTIATTDPPPPPPEPWYAQHIRLDPKGDWSVGGAGTDLKPLIFYARLDEQNLVDAAKELTLMMRRSGIPVDLRTKTRTECSDKVVNVYDYHIYTGSWSLSPYPTYVYDLYHSSRYFGGSTTSYFDSLSGSTNYGGYCSPEYDVWAAQAYLSTDFYLMKEGVYESQEVYVRDCPVIDLWTDAAFKAYDSKWTGMVNMQGYGVDNAWSFFNMMNGADTTIDYGFHNPVDDPHVFSARSAEDKNLIGLMYEGLITLNPFNFAIGEEVGTTCDFDNPLTQDLYGSPARTRVTYHLRNDVYFHNRRLMTPYDAAFSLILFRDVGPAIYRYHSSVKDIDYIKINSAGRPAYARAHPDIRDDPALPVNDVAVYFKVASMWAPYWGSQYVMDSYLWLAANDQFGWNFGGTPTYYDTGSGPTPKGVLAYKPWEEDVDENGIMDMFEDGTGAWQMVGNSGGSAGTWTWVSYTAFTSHYWSRAFVSSFFAEAFHRIGNVNYIGAVNTYSTYDTIIDTMDGSYIRNAFGSNSYWEPGTAYGKWNVDCDFNGDNWIWVMDLYLWGSNYGREMK